jgi:hypothetical protein
MSSYVRYYIEPTIQQWAKTSLTAEEFEDFENAMKENEQLWDQYITDGLIQIVPIYDTVYDPILSSEITIEAGDKTILMPGTSIEDLHTAERYKYWQNRFVEENGSEHVQFVANIA